MATVLGLANCGQNTNTGIATCAQYPDIMAYLLAVPKGYVFPASVLTSNSAFNAAVDAKLIADTGRAYMSMQLTDLDNKTGDPVFESRDNSEFLVANKPFNWQFRLTGSFCEYKNMRMVFNQNQALYDILILDVNGMWWGKTATDAVGGTGLGGFTPSEINVFDWKPKVKDANPMFNVRVQFRNNLEFTETINFVESAYTVNDATSGLIDVKLIAGTTASTATVLYVSGTLGCGNSSLGATYGTLLNTAALWSVVPAAGGAAIVPSGVAYNAILDQYALTIASTPATALIVGIAIPSVVTAADLYIITTTPNKLTITTP
jgi:hypothetical protein